MLLLLGVAGGLESLSSLTRGAAQFNVLTLFFPVAIALFMGLPGSRLAATIVFVISYLFLASLLFASNVGSVSGRIQIFNADLPPQMMPSVIFVFFAMCWAILALLHWMLFSPPFDEHLGR
jgi:hypothetical protein